MSKRHVGKVEDLGDPISGHSDKKRYKCPYCHTLHNKAISNAPCVVFDHKKGVGTCFRCGTLIVNEGLTDLEYIYEILKPGANKEYEEAQSQKYVIDWTTPIMANKDAWQYLHDRMITNEAMERFDVRACTDPYHGVVYINKVFGGSFTDFYQIRVLGESKHRHIFLRNAKKVCNWLGHADTTDLILVEGYTSGLSAYQHSKYLKSHLNPIVLGGKSITDYQLSELKGFTSSHECVSIWICLDGGFYEDSLKLANKIYQSCYNVEIKIMNLPYAKDPNDVDSATFVKSFTDSQVFEPSRINYLRNKVYNNE